MTLDDQKETPEPERAPEQRNDSVREKIRIRFRKDGPLRFISHNDLMRCWDRLLRRSGLPVKFSQGFHRRPQISSPIALAVGLAGDEEIIELEFDAPVTIPTIAQAINREKVDGLELVELTVHSVRERSEVIAVEYAAVLPAELPAAARADASRRIQELLSRSTVIVRREHPTKPARDVDIRPLILSVVLTEDHLHFRFKVVTGSSVRPEEFLEAVGLAPWIGQGLQVTRSRVILNEPASHSEHVPRQTSKGALHEENNADQCPPTGGDQNRDPRR